MSLSLPTAGRFRLCAVICCLWPIATVAAPPPDLAEKNPPSREVLESKASRLVDQGRSLLSQGSVDLALRKFVQAVALVPDHPSGLHYLGTACARQGRTAEALGHWMAALRADPQRHSAANNLAWLLATHPSKRIRDGQQAVRLAEQACAATNHAQPHALDTLAAAYAEVGRFDQAAETARRALELAEQRGGEQNNSALKARIERYEAGRPFRSLPAAAGSSRFVALMRPMSRQQIERLLLDEQAEDRTSSVHDIAALAQTLATHEDSRARDGKLALRLARHVCEAIGDRRPEFLATLAAAYAEDEQFELAAANLRKAIEATARHRSERLMQYREVLSLYQARRPLRAAVSDVSPPDWESGQSHTARKLAFAIYRLAQQKQAAGESAGAMLALEKAVTFDPTFRRVQIELGHRLVEAGRDAQAVRHFVSALWISADDAAVLTRLAAARRRAGFHGEALGGFLAAMHVEENPVGTANNLAWALACHQGSRLRDAAAAVQLAESVCAKTGRKVPQYLDTLGVAYAAAGEYAQAIETTKEAIARAVDSGHPASERSLPSMRLRLQLYQIGREYRDDKLAHIDLAAACYRAGNVTEAMQHLAQAMVLTAKKN